MTADNADAPLTAQERQNLDDAMASMKRESWSVGADQPPPAPCPHVWRPIRTDDCPRASGECRAADNSTTAAHVHSFTMGVCACGERSDAYLYY